MNGTDEGAGSAGTDVPLTACVRPTVGAGGSVSLLFDDARGD